jgi:hypothetical protein
MEENTILGAVSRIVTDKQFRNWFTSNPREALATMGLSEAATTALVEVAPILVALAVGGVLLDPPGMSPNSPGVGYRDW